MSEDPASTSGEENREGVSIGKVEGGIRGSVIAGRDAIQNIIVVGRFLDFAKVEGLIPKSEILPDLKNIDEAFETTFKDRLGYEFAEATAAAGAILKEFLEKWSQRPSFAALPFRKILDELPQALYEKLLALDYWDNYITQNVGYYTHTPAPEFGNSFADVLELSSLSALWKKHFDEETYFSLGKKVSALDRFVDGEGTLIQKFLSSNKIGLESTREFHIYSSKAGSEPDIFILQKKSRGRTLLLDTSDWNNRQFRIFMVGIVLDLIRLGSMASTDKTLWGELLDLIAPEKSD